MMNNLACNNDFMQVTGHKVTKPMKEKILYLTNGMRYTMNNNMVHTTNVRGRTCSCEQASELHRLLGGFSLFDIF